MGPKKKKKSNGGGNASHTFSESPENTSKITPALHRLGFGDSLMRTFESFFYC